MYETLIEKIKTTLAGVAMVKEVFAYPAEKFNRLPAVVFYPSDFTNAYETNEENAKEYRFILFAFVDLNNLSEQTAFEETLPRLADAIIAAFDTGWDYGTTVAGSRIRTLLNAGTWATQQTQNGKVAYVQLTLTIRTLTNN